MSSSLVGAIVCAVIGVAICACALFQLRTGSVAPLHDYHVVNVPEELRPRLARESGRGMLVVGVGVLVLGVSVLGLPSVWAELLMWLGLAAMVVGIAVTFRAIIRYNGSLFG